MAVIFPGEEGSPFPAKKKHTINGKEYTIKAMSFWDLTNLPDTVIGSVLASLPSKETFDKSDIVIALRGKIPQLIAHQVGCKPEDFKEISAEAGLEIVSDWLEVNATENFIQAVADIIKMVTAIKKVAFSK